MNKLIYPLAGALMLGATLPVLAGPDFQAIEQGRKAGQEAEATRTRDAAEAAKTGRGDCPPQPLILPLDHGPRALTTPYLNQLRKQRFEASVPVATVDAVSVGAALNQAANTVAVQVAAWVAG